MIIFVHLKDQIFDIECGGGRQRVQWLGDVAVHRYQLFMNVDLGPCEGLRLEEGELLNMSTTIADKLAAETHVWVLLKGNPHIEDVMTSSQDDGQSFFNQKTLSTSVNDIATRKPVLKVRSDSPANKFR
jgi:hypothetical protein